MIIQITSEVRTDREFKNHSLVVLKNGTFTPQHNDKSNSRRTNNEQNMLARVYMIAHDIRAL
jgi:hypothetical protein